MGHSLRLILSFLNILFRIRKYVQRWRWIVIGRRKFLLTVINQDRFPSNLIFFWKIGENKFSHVMGITVRHLTLGLVRLVTLNLINKIQDYGRAICSTSFTVTRKWTVTPISFYEIIEFYQNQVLTLAKTYVIYLYSQRRKIMMIISKISNHTDWISTPKIEIGPVMVNYLNYD